MTEAFSKGIERITRGIRSAIKHCADETNGMEVEELRNDIRNAPFHVFGLHDDCRSYFCSHKKNPSETPEALDEENPCENLKPSDEINVIHDLKKHGIWNKILIAVESVAAKSEFLSENRTSNL